MTAKNNGLESENARLLAEVHALNKKIQQTDSLREENHKLSDQVRDLSDELRKYKAKVSQNEEEIEQQMIERLKIHPGASSSTVDGTEMEGPAPKGSDARCV